jgi:hypothetical protein
MNVRLPVMGAIRRFAARRESPRVVEKRTYVFILVPFNSCGNGHAKKSELEQDLLDNGSRAGSAWTGAVFSTLTALDRAATGAVPDEDLNNASGLNHHLMWTSFLRNPLWLPNKSNQNSVNPFRFGQMAFNAKTRREN